MKDDLRSLLPTFKRARDYRLYDVNGRRYLDFWQDGGHAILGHRRSRVSALMKALISKGLTGDLPSIYHARLVKRLGVLIPAYPHVTLFGSCAEAMEAAGRVLGRTVRPVEIVDPAWEGPRVGGEGGGGQAAGAASPAPVSWWRPFLAGPVAHSIVVAPVLPFAMAGAPVALCFAREPALEPLRTRPLSAVVLAGALRALDDLAGYRAGELAGEWRRRPIRGWRLNGVYLTPAFDTERHYAAVFRRFLEAGIILSPDPRVPSIIPAEASEGERRRVIRLFRENPGE